LNVFSYPLCLYKPALGKRFANMRHHHARKMPPSVARIIGYARVSTDDPATDAQEDELRAGGCSVIYREQVSTASKTRPELARLMAQILVVTLKR
jgi:hypothetical protein